MREFKIFAAIADLHIGNKRITADSMKKQLKNHFIKVLKSFQYLDGIFILGDIMHTIVSLNSDYAQVYLWFIDQVYKIAKKKKATVIIIKGTQSHDNDQLSNIKSYINNEDEVDFRIYETIEEIDLWNNFKVLVLPDVKVRKLEEVDQHLTEDKKYDLILGHGLISSMKFFVQESENMPTKTYEYDVQKLRKSSKGPILFGHIHQYQNIKDQFYYVGPFTVLERGGTDSGFLVGGISTKKRSKYKIERYLNPDSARFYEYVISKKLLATYSTEEIIEALDELMEDTKENDLITLRITRDDSMESADKVLMLESRYQKDPRISIVKKIKTKKEDELDEENEERKKRFSYIMDESIDMWTIMYQYYQDEIVTTLPNTDDPVAKLTENDFKRILET